MRVHHACITLAASALVAACAGSPSGPSDPSSGTAMRGQTVSAIDGTAVPGLAVEVGRAPTVMTDTNGYFQAEVGRSGSFATSIAGTAVVDHETTLTGPTVDRVRVSMIPASFDLQAFDQMFRTANSRLQRWTSRPPLVVVAATMSFKSGNGTSYSAIADQMTDAELSLLVAQLTEGLSLLTGGTYTSFASVSVEHPAPDDRVTVARAGQIVVGRYTGITGWTETIGYGIWQEQSDGTVTGGSIFLDRDFDRSDDRRRLLRFHELGHALGYNHVTTRTSIMNPSIGPEPSEFDRQGAIVAFQRPPGNVTPDVDPGQVARGFSVGGGGRWVAPIP